jgi:hypothetical protein
MATQTVIAPDGKPWYVTIPPDRDRAVFCRPFGTTWQLNRFARGDQGVRSVLAAIDLEYGPIETAIVVLDPEEIGALEEAGPRER